MATVEERMLILRMIEQGKISAEDGARLLKALNKQQDASTQAATDFDVSRSLRIRITDLHTERPRVNVAIPVGLVTFGLRFVPESAGVDVAAIHAAIDSGTIGKIVDINAEDEGHRVEIFLE